jgi:hypothetical protein
VVRDETKLAQAITDGAQLIVLAPTVSDVDTVAGSLKDGTHAVVTPANGGVSYLVGPDGVVGVQREGEAPQPFDLPWGRLAIIGGEDSIVPEHFRLAAIADVDVVAVPFAPKEKWELALGLPERSAENRMNLVAATPAGSEGAIYALSADFTLWTQWQGPFTGRISHPLVTSIDPDQPVAHAVVYPAQAANRLVSRNTDLVAGRPWRLMQALLEND